MAGRRYPSHPPSPSLPARGARRGDAHGRGAFQRAHRCDAPPEARRALHTRPCRCVRIMFHTKPQRHKGIKTRGKPSVPSCLCVSLRLCVKIMFHTKAQRHKGIRTRRKPSVPSCLCVRLGGDGKPPYVNSPFVCIRVIRGWRTVTANHANPREWGTVGAGFHTGPGLRQVWEAALRTCLGGQCATHFRKCVAHWIPAPGLHSCAFVLFVDTDPAAMGSRPACLGYAVRAARMSNLTLPLPHPPLSSPRAERKGEGRGGDG